MLMIRLARMGKKKRPFYRIAVGDKKNSPLGKQIEFIGHFDPLSKELKLDHERAKYWLGQGAGCSRTVGMIFIKEGLLEKEDLPIKYFVERKRVKKKDAKAQGDEGEAAGKEKVKQEVKPEKPEEKLEAKTDEKKEEKKEQEKKEGTKEEVRVEEKPESKEVEKEVEKKEEAKQEEPAAAQDSDEVKEEKK
ncbi:30S ribosomal protein S16 [Patescibacteria group bacterium]|nr:30S ribosomal protein S16 [Patescibacteria group bacterium]